MSTSIASGTFPQLFRRSAFVQHDRSIARVQTTTKSSALTTRDWGHKYPMHQQKPPRYVRVRNMDMGHHVTSDWQRAEGEARVMRMWGSGKVRWHKGETREWAAGVQMPLRTNPLLGTTGAKESDEYVEDVDAMWPSEFNRYLDRVRDKREQFLEKKVDRLSPVVKTRLGLAEDKTLVSLAARRFATVEDVNRVHNMLAREDLTSRTREEIQSIPHKTGGLSYSEPAPNAGRYNPYLHFPGRAVERVQPGSAGSRPQMSEHNRPFVVTVGGIAGQAHQTLRRVDDDTTHVSDYVDYFRGDKERGEAKWRVTSAKLERAPRVLSELRTDHRHRGVTQRGLLDNVDVAVELEYAAPTDAKLARADSKAVPPAPTPGTREWVAQDPPAAATMASIFKDSTSLGLGLGARRLPYTRERGSALQRLAGYEAKGQQQRKESDMKMVTDILSSIHPGRGGGSNGA